MSKSSIPTKRQIDKFREAAREIGCDDDEQAFEKRLKEVATSPRSEDKTKNKKTPKKTSGSRA